MIDLTDESALEMPTVGMVTRFPPSRSGGATASSDLARLLRDRHGYPVEVVRLVRTGEDPSGGHPVVMDLDGSWPMSADLAIRRIRRCDVALLHVDRHVPLDLVDRLLSRLEMPVVLSFDEVGRPGSREIRRHAALAEKASTTVVPSDTTRSWLESEVGAGTPIEMVPHWSPWGPFEPRPGPRRNILTWGFVRPGMGAERVCRALTHLQDIRPAPRYRLVGVAEPSSSRADVTEYRRWLRAIADEAGLAGRFEMAPMMHSRERLASEIEQADVIAVVYDGEEHSRSRILTEAASTARPVVATRFPGAADLLTAGMGVTVPHDDDLALADALGTYLTNDDEYRRAAAAGAAMRTKASLETATQKYAALLAGALGDHRPLAKVRR